MIRNNKIQKTAMVICMAAILFCSAYAQGDGFGITNGGNAGPTVTVSNLANFILYVGSSQPYVIKIQGTINVGTGITIASNKTITGVDSSSTIVGVLNIKNVKNVIVKNLNITNTTGDGITIRTSSYIYITHCTVYDCSDGCIDITVQSDFVTISYCRFYYVNIKNHAFPNLIGAADTDTADRGKLHVTFHHNWWDKGGLCRMPLVRFGKVHMYNNYFSCKNNQYSSRSRLEAQLLSEYNYYDSIRDPLTAEEGGIVKSIGNIYKNCYNVIYPGNDVVFTPSYRYFLSSAQCAKEEVILNAGNTNPDTRNIASVSRNVAGSNSHVFKADNPIAEIIYNWTNADSVIASGLPAGIETLIDNGSKTLLLHGTPIDTGTFIYTISTFGCAEDINFNDTLIVIPDVINKNRNIIELSNFQIYPNPVNTNVITMTGSLKESGNITVHIYNLLGRKVYSRNLGVIENGTFNISIPVDNIKPGGYILKVQLDSEVRTMRFIKR